MRVRRAIPNGSNGNGHLDVSRCRIDMLHGTAFKAAFLAEWGLNAQAISDALNLSVGQVYLRLKYAGVKSRDYRQGNSLMAQMIINGTRRAGVQQLTEFTEDHLRRQLRQIGWKEGAIRPAAP